MNMSKGLLYITRHLFALVITFIWRVEKSNGSNNSITVSDNCTQLDTTLYIEDDNSSIEIGAGTFILGET